MKKIIVLLLATIIMGGCRKERSCVCRTPQGGIYQIHQKKMTKREAEDWCKDWDDLTSGIYPCKIE